MQPRCQQVTDEQNGQIGRAVIGAVVVELLAADGAVVIHLKIAAQQLPAPARGAFATPAAQHGGQAGPLFAVLGLYGVGRELLCL